MSEQKIIAFSGRKQAGKNTCANFMIGFEMKATGLVRGNWSLEHDGTIKIDDIWGRPDSAGWFDPQNKAPEAVKFMNEFLFPYIKTYSFADLLKQNVCMDIYGLSEAQCYGSNEDKDTLTNVKWDGFADLGILPPASLSDSQVYMTAREVMQIVGTDVLRKTYPDVWVDATIRRIKQENSLIAVITDCRFPNEVMGVKEAGGKVVRLTRAPFAKEKNQHRSETALDRQYFDWSEFDSVLGNDKMDIPQQNDALLSLLDMWDYYRVPEGEIVDAGQSAS